jgi:hypothetical protein
MNEILRRSCSANSLIFSINGRLTHIRNVIERTSSAGSLRIREKSVVKRRNCPKEDRHCVDCQAQKYRRLTLSRVQRKHDDLSERDLKIVEMRDSFKYTLEDIGVGQKRSSHRQ